MKKTTIVHVVYVTISSPYIVYLPKYFGIGFVSQSWIDGRMLIVSLRKWMSVIQCILACGKYTYFYMDGQTTLNFYGPQFSKCHKFNFYFYFHEVHPIWHILSRIFRANSDVISRNVSIEHIINRSPLWRKCKIYIWPSKVIASWLIFSSNYM